MPAPLDFADLVLGARNNMGPYNQYSQIAQNRQRLEVLSKWFREDKVTVRGGVAIQRQLMVGLTGAARFCQPTDSDVVNITDILKSIQVPFVHCETSWMVVRQHVLMQRNEYAIVDYIQAQKDSSMLDLHEKIETMTWGAAVTASNNTDPWGVFTWLVSDTSNTGFYGGSPFGDGTIAGLTLASLPNSQAFNNYTDHYSVVSPQDAVSKMRDAEYYIGFIPPVDMNDYYNGSGNDERVYANRNTVKGFEDIAMAQGDLGITDIAAVNGIELSFRKHPIRTISALDSRTDNPIVMLDHRTFSPQVLEGDYLYESETQSPDRHNVMRFHIDMSFNFICTNRRRNALLVKV